MTTTTAASEHACEGCDELVEHARRNGMFNVSFHCDACGNSVRVTATAVRTLPAPPQPAPALPRNPELALLKDCARVARYDAAHRPRSGFPTSPLDGGEVRATGVPNGDPPAWMQDRGGTLDDARALRRRLDRLAARARAYAATLDPNAPRSPSVADVLEWLVARARALLDSAGTQGVPLDKRLPDLLAEAFAGPERWARWHPVEPARLAEPAKQPAPVAPPRFLWKHRAPKRPVKPGPDATPFARAQYVHLRARYPREVRAHAQRLASLRVRHLVLVLAYAAAVARWSERQSRWANEQQQHRAAVREHAQRVAAGRDGRRAFGADLLTSVLRVWFCESA